MGIQHSKWQKLCNYPKEFNANRHHQISFDSKQCQLHLLNIIDNTDNRLCSYAKLNILSMEWTIRYGEFSSLFVHFVEQFKDFRLQHINHSNGEVSLYFKSQHTSLI